MRSLLIGQQRAGQCDLLKWKVSFSGKPHLRCQTTQTQCWKMKILEGGRCIFRNKWIILSCLVTCYILYNSWDLRLLSHVLYLSSTHWRRAKWGSPSQCWLACSPSSVALSGLNAKVRAGISPPSTPYLDWQPCYGGLPLFSHHCRINMCCMYDMSPLTQDLLVERAMWCCRTSVVSPCYTQCCVVLPSGHVCTWKCHWKLAPSLGCKFGPPAF